MSMSVLRSGPHPRRGGHHLSTVLNLVPGPSGKACTDSVPAGLCPPRGKTAALHPFHGHANAIRGKLPGAFTFLDAFVVVTLGWLIRSCAR